MKADTPLPAGYRTERQSDGRHLVVTSLNTRLTMTAAATPAEAIQHYNQIFAGVPMVGRRVERFRGIQI